LVITTLGFVLPCSATITEPGALPDREKRRLIFCKLIGAAGELVHRAAKIIMEEFK